MMCRDCDYKCASCNTEEDFCEECAGNRIEPHSCYCPLNTYDNGTPFCPDCNEKCKTCHNMPDNCLECAEGRVNPPECHVPEPTA